MIPWLSQIENYLHSILKDSQTLLWDKTGSLSSDQREMIETVQASITKLIDYWQTRKKDKTVTIYELRHHMRAYVTSITGFSDLLILLAHDKHIEFLLEERQTQLVKNIGDAARHLMDDLNYLNHLNN